MHHCLHAPAAKTAVVCIGLSAPKSRPAKRAATAKDPAFHLIYEIAGLINCQCILPCPVMLSSQASWHAAVARQGGARTAAGPVHMHCGRGYIAFDDIRPPATAVVSGAAANPFPSKAARGQTNAASQLPRSCGCRGRNPFRPTADLRVRSCALTAGPGGIAACSFPHRRRGRQWVWLQQSTVSIPQSMCTSMSPPK